MLVRVLSEEHRRLDTRVDSRALPSDNGKDSLFPRRCDRPHDSQVPDGISLLGCYSVTGSRPFRTHRLGIVAPAFASLEINVIIMVIISFIVMNSLLLPVNVKAKRDFGMASCGRFH